MRRAGLRRGLIVFGLYLLVVALGYVRLQDSSVFRELENASFDLRLQLRGEVAPADHVSILVIDDASLQRLGSWPPPRGALAAAIAQLSASGASVVAFDLLLLEAGPGTGAAADAPLLVQAVKRLEKPVLAMAFGFAEPVPMELSDRMALGRNAVPVTRESPDAVDLLGEPAGVFLPFRPLTEHAYLGHVNVFVEPLGELRYLHPAIRHGGAWYPALAVQATALHLGLGPGEEVLTTGRSLRLGAIEAPLDAASRLVINPYGPPGTFRHHSLVDLLDGRLPPGVLDGRIVLVGTTATGVRDRFSTSFHPQVPGVEIFATVIDNLLTGRLIDRSSRGRDLDLAVITGASALALALFVPLPLPVTVLAALLLLALPFAVATAALLLLGLWLNIVFATLGVLGIVLAAFAMRFRRLRLRGRQHEARSRALERYVSPLMRGSLAEAGAVERAQLAAILFADLEGFTTAAEHVDPDRLQPLLQRFYQLVEAAAVAHGAVVAGYAGDGAMLIFGLPEPTPDDPGRAITCGAAMLAAMPGWHAEARAFGIGALNLRIGINYGRVRMGHVGGGDQIQLTATGDVVNVASRLQSATRTLGTPMLVSATTVEAARAQHGDRAVAGLRMLPPLELRGREAPVPVYAWQEVIDDAQPGKNGGETR
jgi:adenylate cyclase